MWSPNSIDFENIDLVLDKRIIQSKFEPTPYTFTKIENGKKTTADSTSLTPPRWLILDHTIAVIWTIFNSNPALPQLSIDDLKWAYEFLKGIKNKKGENPPDVKVCLKEIQDRLINLYAKLTTLKEDYFDEIAAAFGEKLLEDTPKNYFNTTILEEQSSELKVEKLPLSPSKTRLALFQNNSSKDVTGDTGKKNITKTLPLPEEPEDIYEQAEDNDEEVEKYVLSLFDDDKKGDSLQSKPSTKSLIPMKQKSLLTEVMANQDSSYDIMKKEKTSKRVHCFAEMRSLKFQKSMKVKDTNGEEAAYSNLKAEIQRLTINPNVSRKEVMKFLKDWRSEQVDRLHNELKRLSSIEEFMKSLNQEEVEPNEQINSKLKLKDFDDEKNYSLTKSLFP